MKQFILFSAVLFAFASALAQDAVTSKNSPGKTVPLTGCISPLVNPNGNYVFTNGRFKRGVELIPGPATEDISTHAGHEVKLTGNWISEPSASKKPGAQKYEKYFQVASIQHLSDTCPTGSSRATPK